MRATAKLGLLPRPDGKYRILLVDPPELQAEILRELREKGWEWRTHGVLIDPDDSEPMAVIHLEADGRITCCDSMDCACGGGSCETWYGDCEHAEWMDVVPSDTHLHLATDELKRLNSDGRAECAACGGQIREPYRGIRYCPKCEG